VIVLGLGTRSQDLKYLENSDLNIEVCNERMGTSRKTQRASEDSRERAGVLNTDQSGLSECLYHICARISHDKIYASKADHFKHVCFAQLL
jgi:hypothetical protein